MQEKLKKLLIELYPCYLSQPRTLCLGVSVLRGLDFLRNAILYFSSHSSENSTQTLIPTIVNGTNRFKIKRKQAH